jgi:Protein of unknown function (DUF1488)
MLNFPNSSRSFDGQRRYIRFWGSDGAIEVALYLELAALKKLVPTLEDTESDCISAFDTCIDRIHEVAKKVYRRNERGSYVCMLTAHNF